VAKIKQKFGKAPRYMRVDNGVELVNMEVKKFTEDEGIIKTTAPYSPSQKQDCRTIQPDAFGVGTHNVDCKEPTSVPMG